MMDVRKNLSRKLAVRCVVCFVGISTVALGVALTTKASLGTTPISALPYVASVWTSVSMGMLTGLFNVLLVAGQVLLLGRRFPRFQYVQIPVSCLFGFFIDVWMGLLPEFSARSLTMQVAVLGAGTVALALGVFLEVSAGVVMMAGEGAVKALTLVSRKDFGALKVYFDTSLVLGAILLSLLLFHEVKGVGVGTVVSAIMVGIIVKQFHAAHRRLTGR